MKVLFISNAKRYLFFDGTLIARIVMMYYDSSTNHKDRNKSVCYLFLKERLIISNAGPVINVVIKAINTNIAKICAERIPRS